ncbi:MAG: SDR family NAD(P)-dependent oxidoreductase [Candidatus Aminicenantaceae bacterium]
MKGEIDMESSAGRWACITGATSGIGEAFAGEFAEQGYHLILTGRNRAKLEYLARRLSRDYEINTETETRDLSKREEIEELAGKLQKKKDLKILVNNAGFGTQCYFDRGDFSAYEDMLYVNELAVMRLTRAALPQMISAGDGMIINVSSTAAFTPYPLNAVYAASKTMVKLFSESLFLELQDTGVYVQALCPGITRTEFHQRMGLDEERIYKSKGIMKAMDAEEVVKISMKCARKKKAVCVPGFNNKIVRFALKFMPGPLTCRIVKKRQMPSGRD